MLAHDILGSSADGHESRPGASGPGDI